MNFKNLTLILPVAGIILGGAAFAGGMATEKALSGTTATTTTAGQSGAMGGPGGAGGQGMRPTIGTVTAVDGSTITVADSMAGTSTKVTLSGSTTITNGTATASASDIKAGSTVAAFGTAGTDGSVAATQVQLNPTMGTAPGGMGGAPGSAAGMTPASGSANSTTGTQ